MTKFRDNAFYLLSLLGFVAWIVNTVAVMRICGLTHPILIKELSYLGMIVYSFYFYSQKHYDNIQNHIFRTRGTISQGDIEFFRLFGPWMCLMGQLLLTIVMINFVQGKLFSEERPQRSCEWRRFK